MKKPIVAVLAVCVSAAVAFAAPVAGSAPSAPVADGAAAQEVTLKGVLVDNMCAGARKGDELNALVKTHTKACALMDDCAATGYSLVSDGMLMKFDKESGAKIVEFLKQADSSLQVEVKVKKVGEELSLVSIANQAQAK